MPLGRVQLLAMFFSLSIFTGERSLIDIPSIGAWQILGWLIGILLLWWIAYGAKTAVGEIRYIHKLTFDNTFDSSRNPMQNHNAHHGSKDFCHDLLLRIKNLGKNYDK